MMWREMPDQQLEYINQRHAELTAEAASDRFAARPAATRTVHGERGFTGLHVHLGTLLIVIGRSLRDDEPLRHDAARS
jgi:hypothetical protein